QQLRSSGRRISVLLPLPDGNQQLKASRRNRWRTTTDRLRLLRYKSVQQSIEGHPHNDGNLLGSYEIRPCFLFFSCDLLTHTPTPCCKGIEVRQKPLLMSIIECKSRFEKRGMTGLKQDPFEMGKALALIGSITR